MTFKIVIRRGLPRFVTGFAVSRLDHDCTDQTRRDYSRRFPRRIRIYRVGRTSKYAFSGLVETIYDPPLAPGNFFVSGDLRRSARRVFDGQISSTIRFPSALPSGETACVTDGLARFTARRLSPAG
ncbi:MAG TPA: hypothetical protein VFZ41_11380 [Solirubrobacterales bacterium]